MILRLLIALALCVLWWWLGPLIAIGIYRPLSTVPVRAVLVVLTLAWGLWPIWGWWRGRARAPVRAPAPPTALHPVMTKLRDASRTLRHVQMARQRYGWQRLRFRFGRRHLREHPWFLLLGTPGVGKSAMVPASGQAMLLGERYGIPATASPGSTSDCNIWLTEQAAYIDTAGSMVAFEKGEADAIAWQNVIHGTRRLRGKDALDGVVLCFDAAWLDAAAADIRKSLVDAMRARLLELAQATRRDMPVYIVVCRLDRLRGGRVLMATLSDEHLADGMGFSLPGGPEGIDGTRAMDAACKAFESSLHDHILRTMHGLPAESASEAQASLLEVSERIGVLRAVLVEMVAHLFPPSPTGFSAFLRGVWYGSAAEMQAIGGAARDTGSRQLGRSYAAPLQRAIDERGIGRLRGRGAWRRHALRNVSCTVIGLSAVIVAGTLVSRYLWEREHIDRARAGFEEARRISKDAVSAPNGRAAVVQASEQLRYMAALLAGGATAAQPFVNPFIEHRRVDAAVAQTYRLHLNRILWPDVEQFVAATLRAETEAASPMLFDTLRIYLMLGHPERRHAHALVHWFGGRWDDLSPAGSTASDKATFEYHLRSLFTDSSAELPTSKPDLDLIRRARTEASKIPRSERVLAQLLALPVPSPIMGVSLAAAAGDDAALGLRRAGDATMTDIAIPAIFTVEGYHEVVVPALDHVAAQVLKESSWVLAERASAASASVEDATSQRLGQSAHRLYLERYASHWRVFLRDVRIRQVASLDDAASLARYLAEPDSPLARLLAFASRQTTLATADHGFLAQTKASARAGGRDLLAVVSGDAAGGTSLSHEMVDRQFDALHRLVGKPQGDEPRGTTDLLARPFNEVANQLQTLVGALRSGQLLPQGDSLNRLRGDAERQPDPVGSMLGDLVRIASTQGVRESRAQLAAGASGVGSGICARSIAGRYPFDRSATSEVGADDFARVFSRNGTLQAFFDQRLAPYVDANAFPWRARAGADTDQSIVSDSTLRSFEHAARIRDSFFAANGQIGFNMLLRPLMLDANVLEAILDIDGQVVAYSHGPQQPHRIQWPGPRGGVSVRLSMRTTDQKTSTVQFDGPWALFRLYDISHPRELASDTREITLATPAGAMRMEVRASTQDFPLWSAALTRFRCPR